ncbi:glucose-methanol-choline (gmc) oxidoreductase [Aspergillus arachidicola]|uniref:Glucose-methanol-choline (Gmc) oxidoreductase n=1 Tax=Aspergillus arachidicola TaxID=656916 RepID=A0A2G7G3N8_9EURO|nr:glucose-methanol-choline (gmc) oxidoreductase [Aspergillus arachidicola]
MFVRQLLGLLAVGTGLATAVNLTGYEYVVVGSGAGGGPLAARLALAGHKTLLIEAGDDQGLNLNYSIPAYSAKASEDEEMSWNFFVRHYADEERQARDYKTSYETPDGEIYTGLNPPEGSTMKGTLYPRTGTLGGCTAHNALIAIYPHQSDFEYIATLTGDGSWSPDNMRKYFAKLENNNYLLPGQKGHGYDGWLHTETAPSAWSWRTPSFSAYSWAVPSLSPGYYQIPISTNDAHRNGPREFILAVRDAKNDDGSKKYPLDVRTNCFVTKVTFDESENPPRATGVEFLDGQHLYRASPLANDYSKGTPGTAQASREVIVAGGVYNSPQLLKLSGVGPAEELQKFGIKVISDLPGVGTNLQDHYEITVQGHVPKDWAVLDGCTFSENGEATPASTDGKLLPPS